MKPVAWQCEVCGTSYTSAALALDCERQRKNTPKYQPGDVIVIAHGYSWRDGDDDWFLDAKGYKFHDQHTLRFLYVVTRVEYVTSYTVGKMPQDHVIHHEWRYEIYTDAVKQIGHVYTTGTHHMGSAHVPTPALARKAAKRYKEFSPQRTTRLL
jgi:hypothetical protein